MIINWKNTNERDTIELKVNSECKHLGIIIANKPKFDEHLKFTVQNKLDLWKDLINMYLEGLRKTLYLFPSIFFIVQNSKTEILQKLLNRCMSFI